MNIAEMTDVLVTETRLKIYEAQLKRRVREAVRAIHTSAFFNADVQEDFIELTGLASCNFKIPLPNSYRKLRRIKPMATTKVPMAITTEDGCYTYIEVDNLLSSTGYNKTDTYYIAGNVINISSSGIPPALYLSWYITPDTTDDTLETWIMRDYEQVVLDWALARFWKANGKESIARSIESTLYSIDLQNIINNHATIEEI